MERGSFERLLAHTYRNNTTGAVTTITYQQQAEEYPTS
jgi:hypothetical protein